MPISTFKMAYYNKLHFFRNKGKHEEFEDTVSCINKLCESVNLNHLFRNELDLLPPDVLREIENLSPSKEL